MKLPRDLSGKELAELLGQYGYQVIRQTGSHLRLRSALKGQEHQISIPAHQTLKVGTLSAVLLDVAAYLEMSKSELASMLFQR